MEGEMTPIPDHSAGISRWRARAAALVAAGVLASISGLPSCAYLPQKNITASVLDAPSIEEMWGDELMQERELTPRGIDAKTFRHLAPEKQDELFQLYVKYYYVFPTTARTVTLQRYRKLPATRRAAIEKTYVKTYAAEYPASPAQMSRRFFGSRPLPWLVAYERIVAQGLLNCLKVQSSDALFNTYFSNYAAAAHYEIYRAAIRDPAHASRESRKAICSMLNWGHNGRRFDGEGYQKILYFAKPDEIESLGIQKKQVHYGGEVWEIYALTD